MPIIKHEHKKECDRYDYKEWVAHVAPDVLWFSVQDVGSYRGSVFGFGLYKGKLLIYEDSYGSCSGCGAWGDGGEPETQDSVLNLSKLFDDIADAKDHVNKISRYDGPDMKESFEALEEADQFRKKSPSSEGKS